MTPGDVELQTQAGVLKGRGGYRNHAFGRFPEKDQGLEALQAGPKEGVWPFDLDLRHPCHELEEARHRPVHLWTFGGYFSE